MTRTQIHEVYETRGTFLGSLCLVYIGVPYFRKPPPQTNDQLSAFVFRHDPRRQESGCNLCPRPVGVH